MSTRREKSKPQKPQTTVLAERPQTIDSGTWKENLDKYLIDISKYVVTGVLIASLFKDIDDKTLIYILSSIVALIALIVGLVLTNKKKKGN